MTGNLAEIMAAARPGQAFSTGTDGDIWASRWCNRCANDAGESCQILLVALTTDTTPAQWRPGNGEPYRCTEFDGGDR